VFVGFFGAMPAKQPESPYTRQYNSSVTVWNEKINSSRLTEWFSDQNFQVLLQLASQVKLLAMAS